MSSDARTHALQALNDAISAYANTVREGEGWYVTGWSIAITSVHPDRTTDGEVGMLYESAPGQPWHSTLGMITAASDYYRGIGVYIPRDEGD